MCVLLNRSVQRLQGPHRRAVSSVPVSEGIQIRLGCQFVCSVAGASTELLGGMAGFLPCSVGRHLSRLRHLGCEEYSHGLTSSPIVLRRFVVYWGIRLVELQSFWMVRSCHASAPSLPSETPDEPVIESRWVTSSLPELPLPDDAPGSPVVDAPSLPSLTAFSHRGTRPPLTPGASFAARPPRSKS